MSSRMRGRSPRRGRASPLDRDQGIDETGAAARFDRLSLAEAPGLGCVGWVEGTRELVVTGTAYIVPYRVKGGRVEVIAILHGAQRWPDRLP